MISRTVIIRDRKYTIWCETEEQFNMRYEALKNIPEEEVDINGNDNQ